MTSEEFKKFRIEKGYTQKELAEGFFLTKAIKKQ